MDPQRVKDIFFAVCEAPLADRGQLIERMCGGDEPLRHEVEALLSAASSSASPSEFLEKPVWGRVLDINRPGLLAAPAQAGGSSVQDSDCPAPAPNSGQTGAVAAAAAGLALPETAASVPVTEGPGTQLGPYKLLQRIGEGGFGVVYMAEQEKPVRRLVALKIIKLGMDTRSVIARFEQERQALAMMDHPHIARVFDAGATHAGRPYFVMELVRGIPVTEYCDQYNLTARQRCELFISVCQAVQHAHTKGIIHRDLKPSNVLVTLHDGKPVPKVIDFGIAKATGGKLTDRTLFTEFRAMIGTPAYMSPEQAELSGLDIDTRSDIYSLGVMLYELLTGTTPFDERTLVGSGYDEMRRIIREVEPPRPSARVSGLSFDGSDGRLLIAHSRLEDDARGANRKSEIGNRKSSVLDIARRRHTDPQTLVRSIRGDLDWIVMACLEKDRTRRYETASALAADLQRHLRDEPVLATPPSQAYRLRKFIRRNRGKVYAGAAVAAVLLLGGVGTTVGFVWALGERDRAVLAETTATQRAVELKQVSDFQAQMLSQVDPTQAGKLLEEDVNAKFEAALARAGVPEHERGAQIEQFTGQWRRVNHTDAARELIDRTILKPASAAIDRQFKDQPLVDAHLRQVLADRYRDLGLYDAALPLQEQALATRRHLLGEEDPNTLSSVNNMGYLLQALGKLSEAEPFYREALETMRRVLGEEHSDTLAATNNMGYLLQAQGKLSEAEGYYRGALENYRRTLGDEHPDTLTSINNMGVLLKAEGKLNEAEAYFREALEKRRRALGDEHPHTLASINNLARGLQAQGKLAEAEGYYHEALDQYRRVLGDEHPDTRIAITNMGGLLIAQGKLIEAEPYLREALEQARRVLGEEHPDTLGSIHNMGFLLKAQGRLAEAEPYFREALEKLRAVLGEEHPDTLISIMNIGALLRAQGKLSEAEGYYREALENSRRVLGAEHPNTLTATNNMGVLLRTQGKLAEAEGYCREALETSRRVLGDDHPDTLSSIYNMGALRLAQAKLVEAEPYFREALTGYQKKLGPAHWQTGDCEARLGKVLAGLSRPAEAEMHLLAAEPVMRTAQGVPPGRYADCVTAIIDLYEKWHAAEPDAGYDAKAAEWRSGIDSTQTVP